MPRKAFVADLQDAITRFHKGNVSVLRAGEEDGMITFEYSHNGIATEIMSQVLDLGEYPESHTYIFYTNTEHVDPLVHGAVNAMSASPGTRVFDLLNKFTRNLDQATASGRPKQDDEDEVMIIDSDGEQDFDDEEEEVEEEQDNFYTDEDSWPSHKAAQPQWTSASDVPASATANISASNSRIRHDIRLIKEQGFRVSHIGQLLNGGRDAFLMISIRVARLNLPEEALEAWHLDPSLYFILLIRYTAGYKPLDRLTEREDKTVQFKVGLNERHKLTVDDAVAAFSRRKPDSTTGPKTGLKRMFIGAPLEELLNDRLVSIVGFRTGMGLPWDGAARFYADFQGRNLSESGPDSSYWAEEDTGKGFGALDHMNDKVKNKSFPLLAMQLTLRHLVRCTDFCLVCHRRIEADFEALKPYVCSRDICLYQYMSLGFGPSIEHEIITQPLMVDLLISFCYSSARARKLRYLPVGMALVVPSIPKWDCEQTSSSSPFMESSPALPLNLLSEKEPSNDNKAQRSTSHIAAFDKKKSELIFRTGEKPPLKVGTWITMEPTGQSGVISHYRVTEVMHPTVRLSTPVTSKIADSPAVSVSPSISVTQRHLRHQVSLSKPVTPAQTPPLQAADGLSNYETVEFFIYDQNFDDLEDRQKQQAIYMLLETLPSVNDMKDFLQNSGRQEISLQHWTNRISDAALGILRWIIASNRSCIVQVDGFDGYSRKPEERVSGMPNWMQFRFAQGAPDKEQRFVESIRTTTAGCKFPTMFAWHGSPLYNWHGIVREGLHFEKTVHGRAFGDGVYHSLLVSTSMGYSSNFGGLPSAGPQEWPQSQLKISQALALNEIVNCPAQFVSKSPHLVVAQLDWIQSRYLFVKCNAQGAAGPEMQPRKIYEQDPNYQPIGANGTALVLPQNAVSKSRRPTSAIPSTSVLNGNKKVKMQDSRSEPPAPSDIIYISDDTDSEDLQILFSDKDEMEELLQTTAGAKGKEPEVVSRKEGIDFSGTDFIPETHNMEALVLLNPPSYATSSATRTLQRELTATLKVQDALPARELGWYIDPNLISNVYQWIVELHSFEAHLPLASDMRSKNLKSIMLEIRFGKEYPMSPPFVRVIRPRFLSFMQGGGGHVTAGGALCMELLTNSGWSAVSNIESVLLQVRLAMSSTDPQPARLENGPVRDYAVGEAVDAFVRACNAHGWPVPPDFLSSFGSQSRIADGPSDGGRRGHR